MTSPKFSRLKCGVVLFVLVAPALPSGGGVRALGGATPEPDPVRVEVVDVQRELPVSGAMVLVDGRSVGRTAPDGSLLVEVAPDGVLLRVDAAGYLPWEARVRPPPPDAPPLTVALVPDPFRLEALEVRVRALGAGSAFQPSAVLDARTLAERMATSVAQALAGEPGVTVRTNGPMASQPVIRGLSGDRVVVLEDGLRTGDITTTAPDHAVTIEPATARQIEVLRGPAALLHGSNTLGGVVNVRREAVPASPARGLEWKAASYGESMNRGGAASGWVRTGRGPLVVQADGALRGSSDVRTPGGDPLPFTDVSVSDLGAGAAWIGDEARLGGAVRGYRASYGVPSSFDGMTLPGSHVGGVYVETQRLSGRADAEWQRGPSGTSAGRRVESVAVGANAIRFEQWEYEQGGFVGTRFAQLAGGGDLVVRHGAPGRRGALGAAIQWKDLRAEGSFTGTRPATHRTLSAFAIEEVELGSTRLLAGLRLDRIDLVPLDSTETLLVRDVRTRSFVELTGAAGVRRTLGGGWAGSLYLARAFRPPSIEELFSAGPHLASYAYEIGDPSLEAERGVGSDLVLEHAGSRGRVELTLFGMRMRGYVAYAPVLDPATGRLLRDPRLRRYVVYAPEQVDARLYGGEFRVQRVLGEGWGLDIAADLVRGFSEDGDPLPNLPPASGRLEVRRFLGDGSAALQVEGRLRHRATPSPPAEAELTCTPRVEEAEVAVLPSHFCPTPGTILVGGVVSLPLPDRWTPWETRLTLGFENLLDTTWRDPLWRAKQVAPQPGRNIRFSLQVQP